MAFFRKLTVDIDETALLILGLSCRFLDKINPRLVGVGILAMGISNFLFDYVLYAYMLKTRGLIIGGIIMAVLSAIACLAMILFYNWAKRDWLAIEAFKEIKQEILGGQKSKVGKLVVWFVRKGRWAEFLFLSLKFDPFVTTAYMQKGVGRYKMDRRDWLVFWISVLIANAYWALVIFVGIKIYESNNNPLALSENLTTILLCVNAYLEKEKFIGGK